MYIRSFFLVFITPCLLNSEEKYTKISGDAIFENMEVVFILLKQAKEEILIC